MDSQQSDSDLVTPQDLDYILTSINVPSDVDQYVDQIPPNQHQTNHLNYGDACHSTQALQIIPSDPLSPTGSLPSTEEFPGPYNFKIKLEENSAKTSSWVYSSMLDKVFIDVEKVLMVQFHMNTFVPGLSIRALPVYTSTDHIGTPVSRCTVHAFEDDPNSQAHALEGECCCHDYKLVGHVLRAESSEVIYCYDQTSERHSVTVPAVIPQPGSEFIEVPYKFKCKTSCPRGMQRRPITVVFTLENLTGEVVGRGVLHVKICSCPKRDKEKQERAHERDVEGLRQFGKRPMTKFSMPTPIFSKKVKFELQEIPPSQNGQDKHTLQKISELEQVAENMSKIGQEFLKQLSFMQQQLQQLKNNLLK